eukprot:TRINITY_DN14483_c0_g1_i1.p1 TRINITY_DN14483_c0_g1~~TRINITY_DN14483_c0_g1_i1.p1  ORF type:complete len:121 (-),score=18.12 TRINITY_DN14483_c0_g1_i1:51-413(-)
MSSLIIRRTHSQKQKRPRETDLGRGLQDFCRDEQTYVDTKQMLHRQSIACQIFRRYFDPRNQLGRALFSIPDDISGDVKERLLSGDTDLFVKAKTFLLRDRGWMENSFRLSCHGILMNNT